MKNYFFDTVLEIMNLDDSIYFITGDLGYPYNEEIKNKFSSRYINFGVAEQSMVGFASGIAKSGGFPIIYSISNFLSMRALEQIRNDLVYHKLPALLVNGGSGFNYQRYGYTHHSIEDIGVLSSIGNINIYNPSFPKNVEYCIKDSLKSKQLSYLRLDKIENEINVPSDQVKASMSWRNRNNNKKLIISSGSISEVVEKAFLSMDLSTKFDYLLVNKIYSETEKFFDGFVSEYEIIYLIEEQKYFGSIASKLTKFVQRNAIKYKCINDDFISNLSTKEILRKNVGLDIVSIKKFLND